MAKVKLIAEVEPELEQRVKTAAENSDLSVSEWVEAAVWQALEQSNGAVAPSPRETSGKNIKPIRLRDGRTITSQTDWDAFAKENPHMHLAPLGVKPQGAPSPVRLRGGSTMAETVREDRGER